LKLASRLIRGRSGVFEVTFDGALVFSKRAEGRFPEPGEVASAIATRLGGEGT
jgi:selT/selW/selH-like putative selenoprotein